MKTKIIYAIEYKIEGEWEGGGEWQGTLDGAIGFAKDNSACTGYKWRIFPAFVQLEKPIARGKSKKP